MEVYRASVMAMSSLFRSVCCYSPESHYSVVSEPPHFPLQTTAAPRVTTGHLAALRAVPRYCLARCVHSILAGEARPERGPTASKLLTPTPLLVAVLPGQLQEFRAGYQELRPGSPDQEH